MPRHIPALCTAGQLQGIKGKGIKAGDKHRHKRVCCHGEERLSDEGTPASAQCSVPDWQWWGPHKGTCLDCIWVNKGERQRGACRLTVCQTTRSAHPGRGVGFLAEHGYLKPRSLLCGCERDRRVGPDRDSSTWPVCWFDVLCRLFRCVTACFMAVRVCVLCLCACAISNWWNSDHWQKINK